MLTRKPRIGEVLTFQSPGTNPVDVVVRRFWDRFPSIMVVRFPEGYSPGEQDQEIIWKHSDGLNAYLSHKEPTKCQETPA